MFLQLREALLWNRPEEVSKLLDAGADPLEENEEKAQLLTHAAIGGNPDLVKRMLSLGCNPNHKSIHKRTPLHDAAYSGNLNAIRVLIAAGADLDCRDKRGHTPLTDALRSAHPKAATELILQGADIHICEPQEKRTPLMLAASMRSAQLTALLLDKGSDVEARDFLRRTPLMHAARSGSPEIVEMLLNAGANIRAMDKDGNDAFYWGSYTSPDVSMLLLRRSSLSPKKATKALLKAAHAGHTQVIEELLSKRASIQPAEPGGESALHNAVLQKSSHALRILLQHPSAEVGYRCGKRLRTALITAAIIGDVHKARMLLETGADLTIVDADGKTAIHHAAANARLDVIRLFKEVGADLFAPAPGGRTLLHLTIYDTESFAKDEARTETMRWLLHQGLDPDTGDNSGITPIMLAAFHAHSDIVRLLIERDADLNITDEAGRTALYHAVSCGTDYGLNDRYMRPKSKRSDKAAPVIIALLEAGADPKISQIVGAAARWRWPGAVALLKKFGATK
jgi:ankyrin repeat protein